MLLSALKQFADQLEIVYVQPAQPEIYVNGAEELRQFWQAQRKKPSKEQDRIYATPRRVI